MNGFYTLSHRVHAVVELDVRLAPADDHVTEAGLFEPDGIGQPTSGTIGFHLEFVAENRTVKTPRDRPGTFESL